MANTGETDSMEALASKQVETFNKVKSEYDNFTKYGPQRWHLAYLENKLETIRGLWSAFQLRNTEILTLAENNQDHQYFSKGYFAAAKKTLRKIRRAYSDRN